jgi:hypothetical protein
MGKGIYTFEDRSGVSDKGKVHPRTAHEGPVGE